MSTPTLHLCDLYGETERPVAAETAGRLAWPQAYTLAQTHLLVLVHQGKSYSGKSQ
jgi:hypothetical protein